MRYAFSFILTLISCVCFGQTQEEDTIAYSVDLSEYVITGQHEPTHYKNAIHRINIIDRSEIRSRGAQTLQEVLLTHPSLRFSYDPILGTSISMRGIGASNVAILKDGVPVIGRLGGFIDLSQIALQNVERIEIVEGALSNLYGNNAAGGVINLITKKSQARTWEGSLSHQYETIKSNNTELNIGYQKDKFGINAFGRKYNYDQFPVDSLRLREEFMLPDGSTDIRDKYPFNPKDQYNYGGQLRYGLNANSFILLKYEAAKEEVNQYNEIRRLQFNPYANDNFFRTWRNDLSLIYRQEFEKIFFEFTGAFNDYRRIRETNRFYIETETIDTALQIADTTDFQLVFGKAIAAFDSGNNFKILAGINYSQEIGSGDRILNRDNLQDSTRASFTEIAPFLDVKYIGIKNTELAVSGRMNFHSVYNQQFTPTFNAKHALSKDFQIRASYSVGYRSPTLKELWIEFIDINHYIIGNTNLRPELSRDVQLSFDWSINKFWELEIGTYRTEIIDRIQLFEFQENQFNYNNVDEYNVWGIQATLAFQNNNLQASTSMNLGYFNTNLDLESAPQYGNQFDLTTKLSYLIPKTDLTMVAISRYTGSEPRYRDNNGVLEVGSLDPFHNLDFSLNHKFFKNKINLTLGIKNLLDVRNINSTGTGGGAHGGGSSVAVSLGRSYFCTGIINF